MTQPGQDRFGRLLVLTLLGFLLLGIESNLAGRLALVVNVVLIIVAFRATSLHTSMPRLAGLAVVGIAAAVVGVIADPSDGMVAVAAIGEVILLSTLVVAIVATVLRHDVVTPQTIMGVLSAYLLIGLSFSWLYLAVDSIDPDAFSLDTTEVWSYSEFSFVVLTTLGFGNEIPLTPLAGRLVVLEALTGQIFLATFLARLVTMFGQRRRPTADS